MRIVTDTASLYSPKEGREKGIIAVPVCVIHGDQAYRDYEEIDVDGFMELLDSGATPGTSQPAIGELIEVFEESKEETLALFIGDGLSGGYANAVGAKNSIDDNEHIRIIDTKTLGGAEHYLVEKAITLREQGMNILEIEKEVLESVNHSYSYVIPADFEFLKRSGRLTPIAAKISTMIKIVPVMTQTEDRKRITLFTVKRSWKKAVQSIGENLKEKGINEAYKIYVCHGGDFKAAENVMAQLKEEFPEVEAEVMSLSAGLLTHGGPGCIVIQAIKK